MTFDFPALGTHWWIEVWDKTDEELDGKVSDFAVQFCSDFERRYSRFLPGSTISRLNTDRTLATPDDETRALLAYGIDLYRRTRGVFNILTGHILEARGYDGVYSFIDKGSASLQPGNPLTDLIITDEQIELRYGNIDLGGYGKGWCIDELARAMQDRFGLEQFLINGGGDIYTTHQDGESVEIFMENPQQPGAIVGSVMLKNRAFAASSPHKRSWPIRDGAEQNHIVSRTTTKDVIYLTAPTATDADAFATTLLQIDDEIAADLATQNDLTILKY